MKRRTALFAGLLLLAAAFAAVSLSSNGKADGPNKKRPKAVLIIRHAEKPPEDDKSVHLSTEGAKRAEALSQLFKATTKRTDPFPTPSVIFATKDSKHSHRPGETVALLAKSLKLTVEATYSDEDYAKLASEIFADKKYADKTILISWHHGMIPKLAKQLGATDAPETWKGAVFDRVWQITYDDAGKASFLDRPQHLLTGDSEK